MVRLIVKDWKSIWKETYHDIESRVPQKEDRIIYVESLDAARKLMTRERLRMLSVVKEKKPSSLYQLAAELGKDIKTVHTDATMLSDFGLLSLEKHKEGGRDCLRPIATLRKITLELAV
ncbi:MAG: hypothetical protein NTX79_03225 [Candidatus Micrarchaeota archaeon]|nr:hypothetical protein [Candidatus Micrarchaeota archaeon]